MLLFDPKNEVISKKKGLHRNFNGFSGVPFTSQCHLDGPPLELMGPKNSMGPGVIAPPLGSPDVQYEVSIFPK